MQKSAFRHSAILIFIKTCDCTSTFFGPPGCFWSSVLPRCSSTLQHDGLHDGFLISCVCLPLWLLSSCCVASCQKMALLLPLALCRFVSAKFTQVRWFIWCLSRPFRTCSPCRLCLPWCLYIVGRMSRLHETRQEEKGEEVKMKRRRRMIGILRRTTWRTLRTWRKGRDTSGMMFDSFDELHCKKHLLALVCVCVFSRATHLLLS